MKLTWMLAILSLTACGTRSQNPSRNTQNPEKPKETPTTKEADAEKEAAEDENSDPIIDDQPNDKPKPPITTEPVKDFLGSWQSPDCESFSSVDGIGYFKKKIAFNQKSWTITVDVFSDKNCTSKAADIESTGFYELDGKSTFVEGADKLVMIPTSHKVTPNSMLSTLLMNTTNLCGRKDWKTGEPTELLYDGCETLEILPESECKQEQILVKVEDNVLYHSQRGVESCQYEHWPEAVESTGLNKVN